MFRFTLKSLAVGLFVAGVVAPGCVSYDKYAKTADEKERTKDELDYTSQQLNQAEEALVAAGSEKQMLEERARLADQLQAENAKLQAMVDDMKAKGTIFTPEGTKLITQDGMYGYQARVTWSSTSAAIRSPARAARSCRTWARS